MRSPIVILYITVELHLLRPVVGAEQFADIFLQIGITNRVAVQTGLTSLAPIPFYKGFSALQVRLTPKNREIHRILVNHPELAYASSRAHFRFIKCQSSLIKSYSFLNKCQFSPHKRLTFRPITANCQSDGFGLSVHNPRTTSPTGRTEPFL